MNYPVGDMVAGLFGAFSIATAIADKRRAPDTPGREIDLSATEALLRVLEPLAVEYEQLGQVRERAGNRATYTAPSNMYRTADNVWVSLVASSDATFLRLVEAMGHPELAEADAYRRNPDRIRNIEPLDGMIGAWFAAQSYEDVATALRAREVPFSKVFSIADVVNDPHLRAREAIVRLEDRDLGTIPAPCVVPRFSGYAPRPPRSGPATGEDNEAIYGELGITGAQLEALKAARII
ncbi:formyl-coenzyme a transferase [Cupriavidus basilensis OR16]|uniref:Formyl-coenzyme a transferase n=1 Tax=Cupriavidus basilensis OR16 TaxID=1127483 RepID=H1S612_9BURK|nr:formyl-coenzyme a transferase [Cupriavidus basilensis OR16]